MEESEEVKEFKKAKETIKRLESHPNVLEWIEKEESRKVEEYVNNAANDLKEQFSILTDADIDWIRDKDHEIHILFLDAMKSKVAAVARYPRNTCPDKNTIILYKEHLLPMAMTHLWGGGYNALI